MRAYIICNIRKIYYIQIDYKPVIIDGFNTPTPLHNEIYNDKNSIIVLKIHRTKLHANLI
jgi:hypothetical protein